MENNDEIILSIIVPVYNRSETIESCIESIINQELTNTEIIIVNDGSTDNTENILLKLKNRDKRIKIINKKNGGVSSARNIGIKNSNGKYIGFVDSDDYVDENMYKKLIDSASRTKSDIVICRYKEIYNYKEKYEKELPISLEVERLKEDILVRILGNANEEDLNNRNAIMGSVCRMIFKRRLILENQILFNDNINYGEDKLFCIQAIDKAQKINIVNECLYNIKIDNKSISRRYIESFDEKVDDLLLNCRKLAQKIKFKYYNDEQIENIFTLSYFENYIYKISNFCKVDNKIILIKKIEYAYSLCDKFRENCDLRRINEKKLNKKWRVMYLCIKYNLQILIVFYFVLDKHLKINR